MFSAIALYILALSRDVYKIYYVKFRKLHALSTPHRFEILVLPLCC